jgi:hypothetical protein
MNWLKESPTIQFVYYYARVMYVVLYVAWTLACGTLQSVFQKNRIDVNYAEVRTIDGK